MMVMCCCTYNVMSVVWGRCRRRTLVHRRQLWLIDTSLSMNLTTVFILPTYQCRQHGKVVVSLDQSFDWFTWQRSSNSLSRPICSPLLPYVFTAILIICLLWQVVILWLNDVPKVMFISSSAQFLFTARSSYASAVLGIVILSVCLFVRLSVRHTRALWRNERTYS